jgi:hypothetical protein
MRTSRKRRALLGGISASAVLTLTGVAVVLFAGSGEAATKAKPVNASPPTINGTPQEGKTLSGDRGDWDNNPSDFDYRWLRCDKNGGSCATISGATAGQYTLKSVDVGNTLRFRVIAKNADGQATATSVPSAVITSAPPATPPRGNGCPPTGNPDQVSQMALPAKLIVDQFQSNPAVLTSSTQSFVLRVHVTSTCGGPVQGALVYATATPFNQFTVAEQPTGSDGWASLTLNRLTNFPVNGKQGILATFLRARKPGENVLAGITGYRLVSVDVNLPA